MVRTDTAKLTIIKARFGERDEIWSKADVFIRDEANVVSRVGSVE